MDGLSTASGPRSRGSAWPYGEGRRPNGHYVAAQALLPVRTAATRRVRDGELSPTDDPFAETKEQLAGFYLIDARDQACIRMLQCPRADGISLSAWCTAWCAPR